MVKDIKNDKKTNRCPRKITWQMVVDDYKKRHGRLGGGVSYWRPYNYAIILIYLHDGEKILYNYDFKRVTFLNERWKH